jgi:hypothetical protein
MTCEIASSSSGCILLRPQTHYKFLKDWIDETQCPLIGLFQVGVVKPHGMSPNKLHTPCQSR